MSYVFNPFTGNLDEVGAGGGGGGDITAVNAGTGLSGGGTSGDVTINLANTAVTAGTYDRASITVDAQGRITSASTNAATTPGGSNTQIQFNDSTAFGGDADLTWNKTTNVMTVAGDVSLSDGGTYTTTLQTITPTANRTISLPNATGTVGLVAGSSGQLTYNNAGAYAGVSTSSIDGSGNITLSGRFISSLNGAASAPPATLTGTWFTGGTATTTKPQFLVEPTGTTSTAWSTSGTGLGVNAASGFTGNLLDLQLNGTSSFNVRSTGTIQIGTTSSTTIAGSNVILTLTGGGVSGLTTGNDGLGTGFASLQDIGYLAWHHSNRDTRLYRDASGTLAQRNGTSAQTFRVYNTYTSGTNYELGKLEWSSNVFRIGTEKGSGGGTARALELQTDGTTRVTIGVTGQTIFDSGVRLNSYLDFSTLGTIKYTAASVLKISNTAENDFDRLQFGGTTSSFPALKRSTTELRVRLADDSGDATLQAQHRLVGTAPASASATGTAGDIRYDADYVYICTATNTWKRAALATW